jgi:hypothetical protein
MSNATLRIPTLTAVLAVAVSFGFTMPAPAFAQDCHAAVAGYPCQDEAPLEEGDINLFSINQTYWQSALSVPGYCAYCTVTLSDDFCEAAARYSFEHDVEMRITVDEAPERWQCVSSRDNCDDQGGVSTELYSGTLFGNTNDGSPCPSGQVCCVPKTAEDAGGAAGGSTPVGTPKTLPDPLGGANIHSIIGNVIRTFAGIAGSIALIMFVFGGILMITSGGESGKVTNARKILLNSAIGLVLIFAAYTFVAAIIDAILAE